MRVLLLGGTRFTGRALAQELATAGHDVTVASRRASEVDLPGVERVSGERDALLRALTDQTFDETIDFIAYDADGVRAANQALTTERYTLISSTWLPRYLGLAHAAAPVPDTPPALPQGLPGVTSRYLTGKRLAERAVGEIAKTGQRATVVRLPVMTGAHDHTKRLHFYRSRLRDAEGLITVGDGSHGVQIASHLDLAHALRRWLEMDSRPATPVWEALPPAELSWRDFLELLAQRDGVQARLHPMSEAELGSALPELLEADPLWRERATPITEHNLFEATGTPVTPPRSWMAELEPIEASAMEPALRERERDLIRRRPHGD